MPTYPMVPKAGSSTPPSAGANAGAAAMAAALPAIAAAIPGKFGMVAQGLASIPGNVLNYQTALEATARENENRERATTMIEGWRPYIGRPKEFNIDPRVDYIAQGVRVAQASEEANRRQAQEAIGKYGGKVAEGQLGAVLNNIERAGEQGRMQSLSELWQAAENEWLKNKLAIGRAELERTAQNEGLSGDRVKMLVDLLTRPYGVASSQGISDQVREDLQFSKQLELAYDQLDTQERIAERNMWGMLGGSGISAGGSIAGGATVAGALD